MFKLGMMGAAVVAVCAVASAGAAQARTCEQLRTLCHGMRDDKRDCIKPYQGCLKTGVFITPLGRVFKATR